MCRKGGVINPAYRLSRQTSMLCKLSMRRSIVQRGREGGVASRHVGREEWRLDHGLAPGPPGLSATLDPRVFLVAFPTTRHPPGLSGLPRASRRRVFVSGHTTREADKEYETKGNSCVVTHAICWAFPQMVLPCEIDKIRVSRTRCPIGLVPGHRDLDLVCDSPSLAPRRAPYAVPPRRAAELVVASSFWRDRAKDPLLSPP
jgi:hypothetical protein